jgi:hypothetical protein
MRLRPIMIPKCLVIAGCAFLPLLAIRADDTAKPGILEGHLKIISLKEVELAGGKPAKLTSENYAEYPLIILNKDGQKEVARMTPDWEGNYRISLPPADYILDVAGRGQRRLRTEPRSFTILPNQTVHVDMDIDTGVR